VIIMEFPCEKLTWDILPAIRSAIALELVNYGKSQKEISQILGVNASTISQYIKGKRGCRIVFEGKVLKLIKKIANEINDGENIDFDKRVCDVCKKLKEMNEQNCEMK
jgi:uncharacterized protein